ncbi:putative permease [Escherichia coli]|uniref:Putative permease n=1 Tax=Escherichia coli TaxID=562 RepID=A0A376ZKE4_ECOLX|nr:putative permease [Escherichia coli]
MKLVEHYIMRGTRRLVLIIVGFLIFIFASYSSQRYLTEAANGTLALDVVLDIVFYKVLDCTGDVVTCWSVCVSWRDARADVYRLGNYRYLCGGGQSGTLVQSRSYLAIPLSIFVTLLSMYGPSVGLCADLSTGAAVAVGAGMFASCGQRNLTLTITDE